MNESKQKVSAWLEANYGKWFFLRRVAKELGLPAATVRSVLHEERAAGRITLKRKNEGMNRQWLIRRLEE